MINQSILYSALDWLFPESCSICRQAFGFVSEKQICVPCWEKIFQPQRIIFPHKKDCFVFSAGAYQSELKRTLIKAKFKHHERSIDALHWLMSKTLDRIPTKYDVITSVPSNYWRSMIRGVDLPATLARELSKTTGIPFQHDLIQKTKYAKRQTKLTKTDRLKNIRKVFKASDQIRGQHVLVIDDIITTGSTILACYGAITKQKPSQVTFLTAAKA